MISHLLSLLKLQQFSIKWRNYINKISSNQRLEQCIHKSIIVNALHLPCHFVKTKKNLNNFNKQSGTQNCIYRLCMFGQLRFDQMTIMICKYSLTPASHMQVGCPGTWGLELPTPNPGSKSTPKACPTRNPATNPARQAEGLWADPDRRWGLVP